MRHNLETIQPGKFDLGVCAKESISKCCSATIDKHVSFNPMMVCDECRQLIKCFIDRDSFRNYVKFCQSRGRNIIIGQRLGYEVVVFKGYEPYK